MRRSLVALALLAACSGDDEARVQIALEVPDDDNEGALLGDVDALEFSVSDGQDFITSRLYQLEDGLPDQLTLSDVPTGDDILFHLSGTASNAALIRPPAEDSATAMVCLRAFSSAPACSARGRSCCTM